MAPLNLVLSYSTGAGYPVKKRGLQLALAHLKDLEFLGPELSCAHAVWLTQEDIQLLADSQTSICHNPSSNLRLKNGVAPVNRLLKQGVNVALERDESGEARVIPVILRDCLWADSTFSKLLALPKDSKPVTSWPNLDEAFTDVARGIRQVLDNLSHAGQRAQRAKRRLREKFSPERWLDEYEHLYRSVIASSRGLN